MIRSNVAQSPPQATVSFDDEALGVFRGLKADPAAEAASEGTKGEASRHTAHSLTVHTIDRRRPLYR